MLTGMNKHTHHPPRTTTRPTTVPTMVDLGSDKPSARTFGGNLLTCANAGYPLWLPPPGTRNQVNLTAHADQRDPSSTTTNHPTTRSEE
jgi:hypothetical protein